MDEQTITRRKGRPKGSADKKQRKSPPRPQQLPQLDNGENARFLLHDLKLLQLPKININDPVAVFDRVTDYFRICAEDDIKPSIASFALSFGVSRFVMFDYVNGRNKTITNTECLHTLKNAYNTINSYYEHMMNNGKINPVAGIFLMKNNMGYKDTTDYVVTSGNGNDLTLEDISTRAGLLSD